MGRFEEMVFAPERWDEYMIPGTQVMKNMVRQYGDPYDTPDGTANPRLLEAVENRNTAFRLAQLQMFPIEGSFDYDHMKALHAHVFQDVYPWAGQERFAPVRGPMTKMYQGRPYSYYPAGEVLTNRLEQLYDGLARDNYLKGLDQKKFTKALAGYWCEINTAHAFREGNTRTQVAFFGALAEQAGYQLDYSQFEYGSPTREKFVAARFHAQETGRYDQMTDFLSGAIAPLTPELRQQVAMAPVSTEPGKMGPKSMLRWAPGAEPQTPRKPSIFNPDRWTTPTPPKDDQFER